MTESDLLRLSMILENQGNTTRNKYICKLVECVIFDSNKSELSASELYDEISNRFQLEFDMIEIKNAIKAKGNGRVLNAHNKYYLDAKVIDQLSNAVSFEDKLEKYIEMYIKEKEISTNKSHLLSLLQNHLYYCFNSNAKNLTAIIGCDTTVHIDENIIDSYHILPQDKDLINGFIEWDNKEKDELFYIIVASCYEYCLITANKNPQISKAVFKSKKFFLDTNMVFRMAGINNDERQIVIKNFVSKCKEVGISLYYTNYVLEEIYRVIDKEIDFIRKKITSGHRPVDAKLLGSISSSFEPNDFYVMYYNWCKEPQNKHNDYLAFRSYLYGIVESALKEFTYVNAPNYKITNRAEFNAFFNNLKEYKEEKRTYRKTTPESVETDVNQVLYIESIRPKSANSLWELNEYLVSADQIFVSWADENYKGVPIVLIPSVWLSLILKVSGRASEDDHKSFCMFMKLRQHHNDEDKININPINLLNRISEKTVDTELKERIITEIVSNRNEYAFETVEDYNESVVKAFDVVLGKELEFQRNKREQAVLDVTNSTRQTFLNYEKELAKRKTKDQHAQEYAEKLSTKKVTYYAEHMNTLIIFRVVIGIVFIMPFVLAAIDLGPFREFVTNIFVSDNSNDQLISLIFFVCELLIGGLFKTVNEIWKYLSSNERKNKLFKKYYNKHMKIMND